MQRSLGGNGRREATDGTEKNQKVKQSSRDDISSAPHHDDEPRTVLEAPPPRAVRVTGEKAREKKLREDPLVFIISPQLVQCKRCDAKIKLSLKSQYDTFHWVQHRDRCLKRTEAALAEAKDKTRPDEGWPTERKVHAKRRTPSRSTTPPLSSDTDSSCLSPIGTDFPLPPSPSTEYPDLLSPSMAACQLSAQAFDRLQHWMLYEPQQQLSVVHGLGEPYAELNRCTSPWRPVKFEESQVRHTCN